MLHQRMAAIAAMHGTDLLYFAWFLGLGSSPHSSHCPDIVLKFYFIELIVLLRKNMSLSDHGDPHDCAGRWRCNWGSEQKQRLSRGIDFAGRSQQTYCHGAGGTAELNLDHLAQAAPRFADGL